MTEGTRADRIVAFLAASGWPAARRMPLPGDASARRYERLSDGTRGAILMDADGDTTDMVARFARVGDWLTANGFSAPRTLAQDAPGNLLLSEDLGPSTFADLLAADPSREAELCAAAADMLAVLAGHTAPDFAPALDGPALANLLDVVGDWYLPATGADPQGLVGLRAAFLRAWAPFDGTRRVLALRDFHAGNLIWLPERQGIARVGLLDFQDAVAAHPAYDLVSLLQDARRDVPVQAEATILAHYLDRTGTPPAPFRRAYALLGAQRSLRILGVFVRLARRDGKPAYLAHLPRVWGYVLRNLSHPGLEDLRKVVLFTVPPPDRMSLAAVPTA
jgi:hypothetical protein